MFVCEIKSCQRNRRESKLIGIGFHDIIWVSLQNNCLIRRKAILYYNIGRRQKRQWPENIYNQDVCPHSLL